MGKISVEKRLKEKKISDIISPKLNHASPNVSLKAAIDLMQERRAGYVVLTQGKKLVGIFTETDVLRKVLGQAVDLKRPISEFMTTTPQVLNPNDPIGKAIKLISQQRFYHIPLVNDKKELAGVLSVRTLIRVLAECYPTEVFNMPPDPNQVMPTEEGG